MIVLAAPLANSVVTERRRARPVFLDATAGAGWAPVLRAPLAPGVQAPACPPQRALGGAQQGTPALQVPPAPTLFDALQGSTAGPGRVCALPPLALARTLPCASPVPPCAALGRLLLRCLSSASCWTLSSLKTNLLSTLSWLPSSLLPQPRLTRELRQRRCRNLGL